MPVYFITDRNTKAVRLVQAPNKAQAIRHVAADTLAIESATAEKVGELMSGGVELEKLPGGEQLALPGVPE